MCVQADSLNKKKKKNDNFRSLQFNPCNAE